MGITLATPPRSHPATANHIRVLSLCHLEASASPSGGLHCSALYCIRKCCISDGTCTYGTQLLQAPALGALGAASYRGAGQAGHEPAAASTESEIRCDAVRWAVLCLCGVVLWRAIRHCPFVQCLQLLLLHEPPRAPLSGIPSGTWYGACVHISMPCSYAVMIPLLWC